MVQKQFSEIDEHSFEPIVVHPIGASAQTTVSSKEEDAVAFVGSPHLLAPDPSGNFVLYTVNLKKNLPHPLKLLKNETDDTVEQSPFRLHFVEVGRTKHRSRRSFDKTQEERKDDFKEFFSGHAVVPASAAFFSKDKLLFVELKERVRANETGALLGTAVFDLETGGFLWGEQSTNASGKKAAHTCAGAGCTATAFEKTENGFLKNGKNTTTSLKDSWTPLSPTSPDPEIRKLVTWMRRECGPDLYGLEDIFSGVFEKNGKMIRGLGALKNFWKGETVVCVPGTCSVGDHIAQDRFRALRKKYPEQCPNLEGFFLGDELRKNSKSFFAPYLGMIFPKEVGGAVEERLSW